LQNFLNSINEFDQLKSFKRDNLIEEKSNVDKKNKKISNEIKFLREEVKKFIYLFKVI